MKKVDIKKDSLYITQELFRLFGKKKTKEREIFLSQIESVQLDQQYDRTLSMTIKYNQKEKERFNPGSVDNIKEIYHFLKDNRSSCTYEMHTFDIDTLDIKPIE